MNHSKTFQDLIDLMARLRAPDGCPWDREQTFATLGPMLIEEAYEVLEAAESQDWNELRDELGDLIFQIIFYTQLGSEQGSFTAHDAITRVHEKMTRRHPHVFGEQKVENTAEVLTNWEAIKAAERAASNKTMGKSEEAKPESMLDGVSRKLPALIEAFQLTTKAARVGFDWKRGEDVLQKLEEEIGELRAELDRPERDQQALAGEIGDLLFVLVNIARFHGVEPEAALRATNRKFRRRFGHVERGVAASGKAWTETSLEEMDAHWDEAKKMERGGDGETQG